jgi:hypothetical protein
MDTATALGSVFAAFGLSGAAGLNAWLPLLITALADRLDWIELAEPFDELSGTGGLVAIGVLFALDFAGDKVPAVDHVLHAVGMAIAPASGALLFVGQTGLETEIPTSIAIMLGALTAGSVHVGRSSVRPASTAATGGAGNPVLSFIEDAMSAFLTAVALLLPILAFLFVIGLGVTVLFGGKRLARYARRDE